MIFSFGITFSLSFLLITGLEKFNYNQNYNSYLEKNDNILAGSKTPIFLVKRIRVGKDKTNSPVEYIRTTFTPPNNYNNIKNQETSSKIIISDKKISNQKKNSELPALSSTDERDFIKISSGDVPDTVYPEILIAVDYETFKMHNENLTKIAQYMLTFWNAVDLRFRQISNPKIRLNIAGLVIPADKDSAIYMDTDSNVVNKTHVWAADTVTTIGKFFSKYGPPANYDVVIGVSSRTILDKDLSDMNGMAFVGGACDFLTGKAAGLISHNGAYRFTTTAAHELGHLLGARHIEVTEKFCGDHDGHLMSTSRWGSKSLHWSNCSIKAVQNFLVKDETKCLRNKPDVGQPYPKILPGILFSRDEQCQKIFGMASYKKHEHNCTVLWCATYKNDRVTSSDLDLKPPAEGSYCGKEKICLNGNCVIDPYQQTVLF